MKPTAARAEKYQILPILSQNLHTNLKDLEEDMGHFFSKIVYK